MPKYELYVIHALDLTIIWHSNLRQDFVIQDFEHLCRVRTDVVEEILGSI